MDLSVHRSRMQQKDDGGARKARTNTQLAYIDPAMQMPGAERAIVDPFKVRNYLLANDHDVGRHKAKFFESLGYHRTRWGELARALYEYAQQTDAVPADTTAFGTKYIVASPMTGPSGRSAVILSVWIVRRTETFPRLVTAYKGEIR
jgi:hypothetical protein